MKRLFHIDLVDSIVYAGVPVHYTVNGQKRCRGYIPTIVSKCGWFLKEQAISARGIFRVSGSAKRVAELQLIFDTPPNYGSQLDWTGYTIHDASNVLRRYLNHLPDPVIPLDFYEKFRDVHRDLTDNDEKIATYQELIGKLPPPHSCLLMYLLDLLALFAHHSADNLMDSKNLASVFQPGVISHPNHAMSPGEYMTSAAVLKFLIDYQSSFTIPTIIVDEDDEELGISDPPQSQLLQHNPVLGPGYSGGYVNASDHERIHNPMVDRGVSFEAEDAVHVLNSGVRRRLSLHKPIIPHSTLPGNRPQRSKSTNSSTSSHHSNHSGLFSPNFLARRRSNRNSKTGSKIFSQTEAAASVEGMAPDQDLSDIPENPRSVGEKALPGPRSSSIRKAVTSPLMDSEESNSEFSSYLSRRKQMKAEGNYREPSVFCQTVEIQFPAPVTDTRALQQPSLQSDLNDPSMSSGSAPAPPPPPQQLPNLARGDRRSQNLGHPSTKPMMMSSPVGPYVHGQDSAMRYRDDAGTAYTPPSGQRRVSRAELNFGGVDQGAPVAGSQRPVNQGMSILRSKSNPGDLTSVGPRTPKSSAPSTGGGNPAMEKFKGLFTGKHRDHNDSGMSSKDGDAKERKRESLTEKQRKYKSQDLAPIHHQGSATINEHNGGSSDRPYVQPPPLPPPSTRPQHPLGVPPPRPPPPPPGSLLMDVLDPPQRIRPDFEYSSPSGASSRSASPARAPSSSSRQPLPANASFASTTSARSISSGGDRIYHGRGLQTQGSSSSLDYMVPGQPSEDYYQNTTRRPSLRSAADPYLQSQLHDQHLLQQARQNHAYPAPGYDPAGVGSGASRGRFNNNNSDNDILPPPPPLGSRSRQGSMGSLETPEPLTPGAVSRERRLPREGSSSSLRMRSNSSKSSSPSHSPALKSLSRNESHPSGLGSGYQQQQSSQQSSQQQQQQHHHQQQQQYRGSSPLAE
ncbi:hypothetical protein BGZ98_004011, partial [Dissophora globulifera]